MARKEHFIIFIVLFVIGISSGYSMEVPEIGEENFSQIIDNDIWFLFIDAPSSCMFNARRNFMSGDFEEAALEMRKAAAFIKLENYLTDNLNDFLY